MLSYVRRTHKLKKMSIKLVAHALCYLPYTYWTNTVPTLSSFTCCLTKPKETFNKPKRVSVAFRFLSTLYILREFGVHQHRMCDSN